MIKINNFMNNNDIKTLESKGPFSIIEYQRDLSVTPWDAQCAFFCNQMGVRKRQVVCKMNDSVGITTQAGAMQWSAGNVNATTGVKGVGDLLKKSFKGAASGESTIKPEYTGSGILVLEPTYRHLFILDLESDWHGGVVLDDGLFKACTSNLEHTLVARSNVSSVVFGKEGLFNLCLTGKGLVVCESAVPKEELVLVELNNDVLKIDGPLAVAWSPSLNFSVERSGKTLVGSAASGEGLVNVYRGTGKVLMAPVNGPRILSLPGQN